MFTIIAWIIFGLIVGYTIQILMSTRHSGNMMISIVLGVIGAIIGGIVARGIFGFGFKFPNSPEDTAIPSAILSIFCAIIGAIALDAAYRIAIDKKAFDGE